MMHAPSRRQVLTGAGCAAAALTFPARVLAASRQDLTYIVRRNGSDFGRHRIAFEKSGGRLTVDIDIDLEVKAAFLTLFKYTHSNREVWENGRLISLSTRTYDNGRRQTVRGEATPEGFIGEGPLGAISAPADIIPTSYWNPATVTQRRLLDTQKGRLFDVAIAPAGQTARPALPDTLTCRKFAMSGDLTLDLFYAAPNLWAGCSFRIKGSAVDYVADRLPDALPIDWTPSL